MGMQNTPSFHSSVNLDWLSANTKRNWLQLRKTLLTTTRWRRPQVVRATTTLRLSFNDCSKNKKIVKKKSLRSLLVTAPSVKPTRKNWQITTGNSKPCSIRSTMKSLPPPRKLSRKRQIVLKTKRYEMTLHWYAFQI